MNLHHFQQGKSRGAVRLFGRMAVLLLSQSVVLQAQTDTIRLYPATLAVPCNTIVDLPVHASRFRGMLSMQGTVTWDTATLRFDSIAGFGPAALALQVSNFGQTQTSAGRIFFSWNDPALRGVSLPDSATLFVLRFTVRATSPISTGVTVGGSIVPLELLDSTYATLPVVGATGQVSLPFRIPGFNPFADTTRVCGAAVTLDAGAGYTQYTWSNGNTLRTADISVNGTYSVAVRNSLGCTATDMTILSLVRADILNPDTTVCKGTPLTLRALRGIGWSYLWAPSGSTRDTLRQTSDTSVSYLLRVTDGITTCTDTMRVTVVPVDTSLTAIGPIIFCRSRDSLVLRAASAAGWQWLRNGRPITGANAAPFRPDSTGIYRAVVRNANGCTDTTRAVSVTVNELPVPRLSAGGDSLLCEGGSRLLTATGGTTYRWYRNDTLVPGVSSDSLRVTATGRYALEALSPAGCAARADSLVTLALLRRANLDFDITGVCVDVPIRFTNRSTLPSIGGVSWRWGFGNGDSSTLASPEMVYRSPGNYRVWLRYANARCPAHADSLSRVLAVIRERSIRFPDQVAVKDVAKPIFARDTATAWQWRPVTGLSSTLVYSPMATLQQNQQYVIQTTLKNGCIVFDSLLVKVASKPGIHVPKAFTPNADGQNDRLFPVLVGISYLRYFRVFNRWGVLVYEARTSGTSIGWDGVYRGAPQPMETYVWVAEAVDAKGATLKAGGNTILIR